tara:strand:+ start:5083 stop:5523 length:441 start_codon:yes stop_codon:yes gene_type:complete
MTDLEILQKSVGIITKLTKVSYKDLISNSRKRVVVDARKILVYILREKYLMNYTSMANLLRKTHGTMIYSYNYVKNCSKFNRDINRLKVRVDAIQDDNTIELRKKLLNIIADNKTSNNKRLNMILDILYYEEAHPLRNDPLRLDKS